MIVEIFIVQVNEPDIRKQYLNIKNRALRAYNNVHATHIFL